MAAARAVELRLVWVIGTALKRGLPCLPTPTDNGDVQHAFINTWNRGFRISLSPVFPVCARGRALVLSPFCTSG
jgi:hypothetical protein